MRRVAKAGGGELVVVTPDARDIDQLLAIVEGRFTTDTVAGEEGGSAGGMRNSPHCWPG